MNIISKNDVAAALIENVAYEDGRYYLHISEDGTIQPGFYAADASFSVICRYADDCETIEGIYAKESYDDEDFMEICQELADMANEWLKDVN